MSNEETIKTECGVCGKEIEIKKSETNRMGLGTCEECEELMKDEKNDLENEGADVKDHGGGFMEVRF